VAVEKEGEISIFAISPKIRLPLKSRRGDMIESSKMEISFFFSDELIFLLQYFKFKFIFLNISFSISFHFKLKSGLRGNLKACRSKGVGYLQVPDCQLPGKTTCLMAKNLALWFRALPQ